MGDLRVVLHAVQHQVLQDAPARQAVRGAAPVGQVENTLNFFGGQFFQQCLPGLFFIHQALLQPIQC